jgi:hypothetical protein
MRDERSPAHEVREIVLVNTEEPCFEGSRYDVALQIDTTPTSRVEWATDPQSEQRSAYDAKLVVDTMPTTRAEPTRSSDSGTDSVPAASSDE